ncbi:MAG: flagellar basal body rod protein FlgC [Oscillospiraceae bacterium]
MSFLNSLDIGGSALSAQRLRMDIISQNIANQGTYNTAVGGDPYCRQLVVVSEKKTFSEEMEKFNTEDDGPKYRHGTYFLSHRNKYKYAGCTVTEIINDDAPFVPVYDPDNPLADEDGYIYQSNVDNSKEQMDLLAAQRCYEANASAIAAVKAMLTKAMSLNGK